MHHDPSALLDLAVDLAEEAGRLLLGYADQRTAGDDLDVRSKSSATDPVSDADRAAEQHIADRLAEARPDDGLLGEEDQAARTGTSGLRWVVDPLDGTVNFLYGLDAWSVSIACEDADGAVVGVVHQPTTGETFRAVRGGGAWLGERRLAVSGAGTLAATLVATGFSYDPATRADQGAMIGALLAEVRDVRRCGSAALDLAWCAAGRVDGYLEFALQPWDWAAGALLVREAGGVVSEHHRDLGATSRLGVIAGGTASHDALATWLEARA